MNPEEGVDVVVVGGGPAGLSAALWLGRCGRRTIVFDSGNPRNAASRGLHGYMSRDGMSPLDLRQVGRAELAQYPAVEIRDVGVRSAHRNSRHFDIEDADGRRWRTRLLLLATGRVDTLPAVPGIHEFYGRGVYHCPYCDGWEHRGQPFAVYGRSAEAANMAGLLRTWSTNLVICTNAMRPTPAVRRAGMPIFTQALIGVEGDADGMLSSLRFADGASRPCRALFFCSDTRQKSQLPESLGCKFDRDGSVVCRAHAATNVPGLFVAGNVRGGVHLAIMAAAEGAEAAVAMNEFLLEDDQVHSAAAAG
jgi:thioredoxin reductase